MDMAISGAAAPDEGSGHQTEAPPEQRTDARLKLMMMRAAKLSAEEAETICVIRDVSSHGVRLRLFHALPADARFELKLANGESYVAEKVWERDGEAGFQFTTPIDLQKFLTEDTAFPKRQIRLRTKLDGVLRCDGIVTPIIVHDLSQQGAQIECPMHLAMNQSVKLETDGLPMLMATVRWRAHPNYGVAFQTVFRMDELAKLSWALRPSASKKRGA